jgi:hypothetical protein
MISSQLRNVTLSGAGTKTFLTNASTTNFTIASTSGTVTLPPALAVSESFTNNATLNHNERYRLLLSDEYCFRYYDRHFGTQSCSLWGCCGDKDVCEQRKHFKLHGAFRRDGYSTRETYSLRQLHKLRHLPWHHPVAERVLIGSKHLDLHHLRQWTLRGGMHRTGTNRVMTSPDGVTWSPQSAAEANHLDLRHLRQWTFSWQSQRTGTNRVMTSS